MLAKYLQAATLYFPSIHTGTGGEQRVMRQPDAQHEEAGSNGQSPSPGQSGNRSHQNARTTQENQR